ncbi:f253be09-173c-410e-bab2-336e8750cee8-CDS [Sclerotinia trifoliorum]|uniref:F253be09-173c-410e-bab2-336e8750cee8-CDS n=1 Tax=Sclerotinia trifoliorum TaxID=28548 RepID=A0A8H2VSF9_9HELO|nr:f253be09-173c-410e-bab2-336e8750cee8-CDS [Sclerotinia trifoliorum]
MMADVPQRKPMPPGFGTSSGASYNNHSRTRTTSSTTFPSINYPPQHPQNLYPGNMQISGFSSRRTPSTGTFSTTASSGGNGPVPNRNSQDLRRSTSSRSGNMQPQGYVALMRKQKATVWCDRSQREDPRLIAQQKAAKERAAAAVLGGPLQGRISTGGTNSLVGSNRVTAKIRHHGKAGLVGYSPGDLVGGVVGVPMRLSASEVEGGDSDDDGDSGGILYHRRTGSGRSSVGSGRRGLTYSRQSGASSTAGRWSSGHTPPSERERRESIAAEAGETPVPIGHPKARDYFEGGDGTRSAGGSISSGERADGIADLNSGDAARLASNSLLKSSMTREKSVKNPDELRRRGSVDERTTTMTLGAGRLFIANPDHSDSD